MLQLNLTNYGIKYEVLLKMIDKRTLLQLKVLWLSIRENTSGIEISFHFVSVFVQLKESRCSEVKLILLNTLSILRYEVLLFSLRKAIHILVTSYLWGFFLFKLNIPIS